MINVECRDPLRVVSKQEFPQNFTLKPPNLLNSRMLASVRSGRRCPLISGPRHRQTSARNGDRFEAAMWQQPAAA